MVEKELFRVALDKSMALCSHTEFCREDIRNKLSSWGVEKNDTERIIEILIKENFLNESRYAMAFVADKLKYNKWGKVKISAHLRFKKLPSEVINTALDSIDNEQYINLIRDLIKGHKRSVKAKNQYDLKSKLMRFGLSKGFESSILYDILNEVEE
jgi:regulatory protein